MAGPRNAADRWERLLGPAERSAALVAESLRDPLQRVNRLNPGRPRRRSWASVVRLLRRVRRRIRRRPGE